eukprot:jgi/Ulvmu1/1901/UM012_0060.1
MASMTITMALDDLYNRWFMSADLDRDGRVMGQEAVMFLTRSELPQATLGKIWEIAAQGAPWLDRASFRRVCQLMWYAQQNGNELPPDSKAVVMKIISGMATLPPPKLTGADMPYALQGMRPVGIEMPGPPPQPDPVYAPSQTRAFAASPATGTSVASSSPHASRAQSLATPGGQFNAEATGAFNSGYTGVVPQQDPAKAANFAAAPTGLPEFPAITPFLASKYGEAYKHASKDASGGVAGQEVLRLLASVPVDVGVKKAAWDLVAGNKGALTVHEFFTMLYLLDVYTVQRKLPDSLPSGIFPPGVHQCYLAAGIPVPLSLQPSTVAHVPLAEQNPVENLALEAENYKDQQWSMDAHKEEEQDPLAAMPPVPAKSTFEAKDPEPYDAAKRLPPVDEEKVEAISNAADKERLQNNLKSAGARDRELYSAEAKFATAKEESDFFMASLQALTLFKSRSERALLDTQSRAESAAREAQEARARYEKMYADARASASSHQELQQHITAAMGDKAEWESKVHVLQQELAALANATPELLEQLQYETEQLRGAAASAEAEKRAFEDQTAGLRASKAQLTDRLTEVKAELESARETVDEAVEVLNAAKQELDFTKTGEDAEALSAALLEAAAAYKALHIKARSAGVPVPKAAGILADEEVVWAKEDLIGARDWMRFENVGWVVMEELPEVPEVFDRTYFLAHDQGDPPDAIVPIVMADDPFLEPEEEEEAEGEDAEGKEGEEGVKAAPEDAADAAAGSTAAEATTEAAAGSSEESLPADAAAGTVEATAADGKLPPAAAAAMDVIAAADAAGEAVADEHAAAAAAAAATVTPPSTSPPAEDAPRGTSPTAQARGVGAAALPADLFSDPAALAAPPATASAVGGPVTSSVPTAEASPAMSAGPMEPEDLSRAASTSGFSAVLNQDSVSLPLAAFAQQMPSSKAMSPPGNSSHIAAAPTPHPTTELSAALGNSLGGPAPPSLAAAVATASAEDSHIASAPTPHPTTELSVPVNQIHVPSLAAAAAAADSRGLSNAPTPTPTAELSSTLPTRAPPSLAAASAAADTTGLSDAPTPAPTAELSNTLSAVTGGASASPAVPSLSAAVSQISPGGSSGPLAVPMGYTPTVPSIAPQGSASGSFTASHTIPEDAIAPAPPLGMPPAIVPPTGEPSALDLTRGVPPTPPSTTQPPVRQPPLWASGLSFTSASGGLAAGAGASSGILPPTPANSEALHAGGSSGVLTPPGDFAGTPPGSARPVGPVVSASDVAFKLSSPGETAAAHMHVPPAVPHAMPMATPSLPVTGAGSEVAPALAHHFPSDVPEESIEILEISASLPLAQIQDSVPQGALDRGAPGNAMPSFQGGLSSANPFAMPAMQAATNAPAHSAEARNVFVPGDSPAGSPWGNTGAPENGQGLEQSAAGQGAGFGSGVTGKANWTSF